MAFRGVKIFEKPQKSLRENLGKIANVFVKEFHFSYCTLRVDYANEDHFRRKRLEHEN